jgi:putative ABC transport system substrate-binding protein
LINENRTVAIEYRWAEGREEHFASIVSEFVQRKVDVIVTYGNAAATSAKAVTKVVPIVFAAAGDPVGTGLVKSLARPGGNLTGLSIQQTDLAGKRLQILREMVPNLRVLAVLANPGSPNVALEMREARTEARKLDLDVVTAEVRKVEDLAPAFESLKGKSEALYGCSDPLLTTNRSLLSTLALGIRLPTMHGFREYTEAGGMISYGPHFSDLFRRAAEYVQETRRERRRNAPP